MTNPSSPTDPAYAAHAAQLRTLAGLLLLGVAVGGYRAGGTRPVSEVPGRAPVGPLRLDPNTASADELAVLPGIGRARARALVAHREQQQAGGNRVVFARPDDLRNVRGFGPATAARASEHLHFPESLQTHPDR